MGLQVNSAITSASTSGANALSQATAAGASTGKSPQAPETAADGIRISIASTALNQLSTDRSEKIGRVTAEVQDGSYQTSSSATSSALVENALSGGA